MARIFSELDLVQACHQIPVADEHIAKTSTRTPVGLYKFNECFSANATLHIINSVIYGLPLAFAYVDDLFVASSYLQEHLQHLREHLECLFQHRIITGAAKSQFGKLDLDFLEQHGHFTSIRSLSTKVKAIIRFPRPTCVTKLRQFLPLVNVSRRFIRS